MASHWEVIGQAGVDSGTLMILDPCYLREAVIAENILDWTDAEERAGIKTVRADGYLASMQAVARELGDPVPTEAGPVGVTFRTYHDGGFPIDARRGPDGLIAEIRIRIR